MTEVAVAFAFARERRQAKLAAPKNYPARAARHARACRAQPPSRPRDARLGRAATAADGWSGTH